ncbi:hypothetical protein AHAS_Ahas11G0083800 [Arachis hypogaea]
MMLNSNPDNEMNDDSSDASQEQDNHILVDSTKSLTALHWVNVCSDPDSAKNLAQAVSDGKCHMHTDDVDKITKEKNEVVDVSGSVPNHADESSLQVKSDLKDEIVLEGEKNLDKDIASREMCLDETGLSASGASSGTADVFFKRFNAL